MGEAGAGRLVDGLSVPDGGREREAFEIGLGTDPANGFLPAEFGFPARWPDWGFWPDRGF